MAQRKGVLVLDAYGGLCNQMMDIDSLVKFATQNSFQFAFQHCSLRDPSLTSWSSAPFGTLFNEENLQELPGYLSCRELLLKGGKTWNSEGKRLVQLIKNSKEVIEIAMNYDCLFIKQGWPVLEFPDVGLDLTQRIKPSLHILTEYAKLRLNLPEKYNFLHYRYEHDFISYFSNEKPDTSFPVLQKILDAHLFSNTEIPLYIAASGLANLPKSHLKEDITKQKNILFTDEKKIKGFNFEASAYLDFLIGEQAVEVFGHSRSSFSHRLNNLKNSSNYYDLSLGRESRT
jgi:hypothetical protein